MEYYIQILRAGKHVAPSVVLGFALFSAYYVAAIFYPLLRAFRERGRMRIICILLAASFGANLASDLIGGFLGPQSSDADLADMATLSFTTFILIVNAANLAAVLGVLARRAWGAILYLLLALLNVSSPNPDTAHAMTVATIFGNLTLALDGAILGLLFLARRDDVKPSVREQLPSIF